MLVYLAGALDIGVLKIIVVLFIHLLCWRGIDGWCRWYSSCAHPPSLVKLRTHHPSSYALI